MNAFRTMLLLAALTALFMALGYTIGGTRGALIALLRTHISEVEARKAR